MYLLVSVIFSFRFSCSVFSVSMMSILFLYRELLELVVFLDWLVEVDQWLENYANIINT